MASEQLQALIQQLRSQPIPAPGESIPEARARFEQMYGMFPFPDDVRREPVTANGVPAEWIVAPGAAEDRVIIYFHGGGYCIGSINSHGRLVARLSRAAQARGFAIDYRLAPEHPFPAAVEDATTAYLWLLANGVSPDRIVIAGDSAGGGLTVATLVTLRYTGTPLPAAGVCLSPWVDLEGIGPSMIMKAAEDPLLQPEALATMASAYLGGADRGAPLAAPLYADLRGLPPLLIQVGAAEILLDDATRLTERARVAGVKVTLEVWPEMIHVWHVFAAMLPEGEQAIERIGAFIRSQTGDPATATPPAGRTGPVPL